MPLVVVVVEVALSVVAQADYCLAACNLTEPDNCFPSVLGNPD